MLTSSRQRPTDPAAWEGCASEGAGPAPGTRGQQSVSLSQQSDDGGHSHRQDAVMAERLRQSGPTRKCGVNATKYGTRPRYPPNQLLLEQQLQPLQGDTEGIRLGDDQAAAVLRWGEPYSVNPAASSVLRPWARAVCPAAALPTSCQQ